MPVDTSALVARGKLGENLYARLQASSPTSPLTDKQLEFLYTLAYAHIGQGRYEAALQMFTLLSLYGPTRRRYLMGLALCLQKLDRHAEADTMYSMVLILHPDAWDAALGMAECRAHRGRADEAEALLERLHDVGRSLSGSSRWMGRARALRSSLARRRAER